MGYLLKLEPQAALDLNSISKALPLDSEPTHECLWQ
jgi:hypothetical protein